MQRRDSMGYTIAAATVLCVVCSFAVSVAAVSLRPRQEENKALDRQRNILDATGLALGEIGKPASQLTKQEVKKLYSRISEKLVDLQTGEYTTEYNVDKYDVRAAAKKDDLSIPIIDPEFNIGKLRREKIARVYFVKRPSSEEIQQVVLPVYGQGLWSTLYGYLALRSDLETIQGLTFYEHAETPGLGGEVDNPKWKAEWVARKLFGPEGHPRAEVYKGVAPTDNPYAVDGLSGATITSRGVTNLVRYWASDDGYGVFLKKLKQEIGNESKPRADKPKSVVAESKVNKPKAEAAKPEADKPKAEAAKPNANKPKAEVAKPKADKPKAEANKPEAKQTSGDQIPNDTKATGADK